MSKKDTEWLEVTEYVQKYPELKYLICQIVKTFKAKSDTIDKNQVLDFLQKKFDNQTFTLEQISKQFNQEIYNTRQDIEKSSQKIIKFVDDDGEVIVDALRNIIDCCSYDITKLIQKDIKDLESNMNNGEKYTKIIEKISDLDKSIQPYTRHSINNSIESNITKLYNKMLESNNTDKILQDIFSTIKNVEKKYLEIQLANEVDKNDKMSLLRIEISSIEKKLEEYHDKYNTQMTDFFNKQNSVSMVDKGKTCEDRYVELLQKQLEGYEIQNSSKEKYSGDVWITNSKGQKILLEIKNYMNPVPTKEVKKFHRDLELNKCYGIMISNNSHITLKTNLEMETINPECKCIYVSNNDYNCDIIKLLVKIFENMYAIKTEDTNTTISMEKYVLILDNYKNLIDQINAFIDIYKKDYEKQVKMLKSMVKKSVMNDLQKMKSNIQ